jgi:hypothetical protein
MAITAKQEQILGYVLPGIGVILTGIRLWIRRRYAHLGRDDLAVFVAALAQISLMIATNLYIADSITPPSRKVGFFYWTAESYYLIIWAARLSILLSIARIAPTRRTVQFCYYAAIGYVAIWMALTIQILIICESKKGWKQKDLPQCPLGKAVAFTQLSVDILGDSVIVFVPAFFFWNSALPVHKRLRLIAVFAISLITTIVGFSHIYYILHGPPLVENLNGILQSSISVIACNLPVVLSSLIRFTKRNVEVVRSKRTITKASSVQFAGLSTLEGRVHESHISGCTGLTGLTHLSSTTSGVLDAEIKGESADDLEDQKVEDLEKASLDRKDVLSMVGTSSKGTTTVIEVSSPSELPPLPPSPPPPLPPNTDTKERKSDDHL